MAQGGQRLGMGTLTLAPWAPLIRGWGVRAPGGYGGQAGDGSHMLTHAAGGGDDEDRSKHKPRLRFSFSLCLRLSSWWDTEQDKQSGKNKNWLQFFYFFIIVVVFKLFVPKTHQRASLNIKAHLYSHPCINSLDNMCSLCKYLFVLTNAKSIWTNNYTVLSIQIVQ